MATPQTESSDASGPVPGVFPRNMKSLAIVAATFWGLAVVFAILPTQNPIPAPAREVVAAAEIDPSPRRVPIGDDARTVIAVFERKCMDCHKTLVTSNPPRNDPNHYHETVRMDHGLNGRCVNCHDPKDRNVLVLRDGRNLAFGQSTILCGNCHGPAYRQWQRGVHGKTLGYWDTHLGEKRRLECVECHDPHSPHYNPMAPLPGPNTLRMGVQNPEGHGHDPRHTISPLIRARHDLGHDAGNEHSKE
jgi:hypothetical protein